MANEAKLTFLDKVILSFERGHTNPLADIAIHEALEGDGDVGAALNVRSKMYQEQALTPIDGNLFADLIYSAANTTGQLFETAKVGGMGVAIGAGVGGLLGLGAGLLIPTVGEEAFTVAAGIKYGAKIGGMIAGGSFSYKQGRGGMFASMIEQGSDVKVADRVSKIGAIPYAAVEALQLATLTKPVTKSLFGNITGELSESIAKKFIVRYGTTLGKEIGEEAVQEMIQISSEEVAKHYSGLGVRLDPEMLANHSNRIYGTMKAALKGFALLPLPGAAFEAAVTHGAVQMQEDMEALKGLNEAADTLNLNEIKDPTIRLHYSLRDTLNSATEMSKEAITKQEEIRHKERGERSGIIKEWRETQTLDWWKQAKGELKNKGKYHWEVINPLKNTLPIESYNQLQEDIRTSTDKLGHFEAGNLSEAFEKLFTEGKPMRDFEVAYAEKQWGTDISHLLKAISNTKKLTKESWMDYANLPRATSASMDLSRTLRQNILLIGSPKLWGKSVAADMKLLTQNEQDARLLEKSDLTSEWGSTAVKGGLRWNDWGQGTDWTRGTEKFASSIARKIPGVKRSERAYSMGGNHIRMQKFSEVASHWKESGFVAKDKDYKDLAHVVNLLTGEGDPKMFGKMLPAMNATFFAPRLAWARVKAVTDMLNPKLSWAARKILIAEMVKSAGVLVGVMTMAAQLPKMYPEEDIEVIGDPADWLKDDFWKNKEYLKTDFGKIRWGKMRFDFFGGYLPMVRAILRVAERKTVSQSGEQYPVHITEPIVSFLQQKLAPLPSMLLDLARKENFRGDPIDINPETLANQFYNRMTPFFMQDTIDALRYQGKLGGAFAAPLAFFGAGVSTYPSTPGNEVLLKKNSLAKEQLGKSWNDLGPAYQQQLRNHNPIIAEWEREAKSKYTGTGYLERIEKSKQRIQKRMFKQLPADVKKEFEFLNLVPSSVSQNISNKWHLNQKLFKQYEMDVSLGYSQQLARLVRSDWWPQLPIPQRVNMLTKVMGRIRMASRQKIIANANMKDFRELQ